MQHWRGNMQLDGAGRGMTAELGEEVTLDDLYHLTMMLDQAGLFCEPIRRVGNPSTPSSRKGGAGLIAWLLHNYLFIRVPLLKPDAFLQRTLPIARLFASRAILVVVVVLGLVGLFIASSAVGRRLPTRSSSSSRWKA